MNWNQIKNMYTPICILNLIQTQLQDINHSKWHKINIASTAYPAGYIYTA